MLRRALRQVRAAWVTRRGRSGNYLGVECCWLCLMRDNGALEVSLQARGETRGFCALVTRQITSPTSSATKTEPSGPSVVTPTGRPYCVSSTHHYANYDLGQHQYADNHRRTKDSIAISERFATRRRRILPRPWIDFELVRIRVTCPCCLSHHEPERAAFSDMPDPAVPLPTERTKSRGRALPQASASYSLPEVRKKHPIPTPPRRFGPGASQ